MKNFKVLLLVTLLSFLSCAQHAREILFEANVIPAEQSNGMMLLVAPLSLEGDNSAQEAEFVDGKFSVKVNPSSTGFYNIVTVKNNIQTIIPAYFPVESGVVSFDVVCGDDGVCLNSTPDNKALSAFNSVLSSNGMALWSNNINGCDMLKELIESYMVKADSLAQEYNCSSEVKKYLEISAYTAAHNALSIAPRAMRIKASDITFTAADVLPQPQEVLDNDIAALFYPAVNIITSSVPRGELCERLEFVNSRYSNVCIKEKVFESIVSSFITMHDTDNYFDAGMQQLDEAISKYGVDDSARSHYSKRRNTMVGNPFPADVVLEDANGNKVDFSTFKGKYVYIDLWASWCGPCLGEIPHLQKLEKELQNDDVVFVSISIDADKEAWLARLELSNMHGYQLLDAKGKIGEALNIHGIPSFLIYDKEGKLYIYKAMRPSVGAPLKELLESLK